MSGVLVISLDFELQWGAHDRVPLERNRATLDGARQAVPEMLALFAEFGVHATWATVGLLFHARRDEMLATCPAERPTYAEPRYDPYRGLGAVGADERADPYHFARSLVEQIAATPGQEVGSHTYSHYYCLERGQTHAHFAADVAAARHAAASAGIELRSFVFPRTQVRDDYLPLLAEAGVCTYRAADPGWMNAPEARTGRGRLRRAARLTDTYLPLGRDVSFALPLRRGSGPLPIPGGRFLRPYDRRLRALEPWKARVVERDLTRAGERGRGYHLWWHPENFGTATAENLAMLRRILTRFDAVRAANGMRSLNMGELGAEAV